MATLPEPVPGLVIRYSYLWHNDHIEGAEEGSKNRPCAIVAGYYVDESKIRRVLVLPVTHSPPKPGEEAIELPAKVKAHLGLDGERSWVALSEWNEFSWPGPDLRRISGKNDAPVSYGVLPPTLFAQILSAFTRNVKTRRAHKVLRSE